MMILSPSFTGAVPAPAGSWRPFSDESPWNMIIENAPLQRAGTLRGYETHDSDTYIRFLDEKATFSTIATDRWSIATYFVDGTTPGVNVEFTGEDDYSADFLHSMNPVPIPATAVSDPGETNHYPPLLSDIIPDRDLADAEMCIIDLSTGYAYDFWHIAKDTAGAWRATAGGKISINGDGVITPALFQTYPFARGTAVPLLAGMILRNEVAAGEIRHALAISIPPSRNQKDFYVWPGFLTDGRTDDSRALPEGARLRLKWSEREIEARYAAGELTSTGRIIARALRRYGAINIDNGGGHFGFFAQNYSDVSGSRNAEPDNWGGLLNMDADGYADDVATIRASDFELIAFEYGCDKVEIGINVNGVEDSITVGQGELLKVRVSLDPGNREGELADWWVAADSPFGLYWFTLEGGWQKSDEALRAYGGVLFSLSSYTVFQDTMLPPGSYTFYFGVDLLRNRTLDLGQIYYGRVRVGINQ